MVMSEKKWRLGSSWFARLTVRAKGPNQAKPRLYSISNEPPALSRESTLQLV